MTCFVWNNASDPPEYQGKVAASAGKWWFERYADWKSPYAKLVLDRNERVLQFASGAGRLLDVGCGFGDMLYLLKDRYSELYGIDPAAVMVQQSRSNVDKYNVMDPDRICQGVAEALPFENEFFDTVTMLNVFEYVEPERRNTALAEVYRVLKPAGELILVTPSRYTLRFWNVFDNLLSIPYRLWKQQPHRFWAFTQKSFTEEFCTKRELLAHLSKAAFHVRKFERVGFYPAPETVGWLAPWLLISHRVPGVHKCIHALFRAFSSLGFLNQKMLVRCVRAAAPENTATTPQFVGTSRSHHTIRQSA